MDIINIEKKKMIPKTNEECKTENIKLTVIFAKKGLNINRLMMKTIVKLKTFVIIQVNTEALNIAYVL